MRPEASIGVWVAIAAGSALGGLLRHAVTEVVMRVSGPGFPWGTLVVNVAGSIAIGVVAASAALGVPAAWSPVARHAAMTGLLGGFTTFSAFSLQTTMLWHDGAAAAAAGNVALSAGLCVAGCWAGYSAVMAFAR